MGKLFTKTPKLNRNHLYFLLLTLNLSFFIPSLAGNPPLIKWSALNAFEQKVFIENKGQFDLPEKSVTSNQILFSARQDGLLYYFTANGIWIVNNATVKRTHHEKEKIEHEKEAFIKHIGATASEGDDDDDDNDGEDSYKIVREFHQLSFTGSNPNATITADDEVSQLYNYATGASSVQAHAYKKIIYRNLYPGIDMEFYFPTDKQGFEYGFIVHPGADVSAIKIQYPLNKNVTLDPAGNIIIQSVFGEFTDHAPKASQAVDGKPVSCSFTLNKEVVQFNVGNYDKKQVLIIDPWTITPVFTTGNDAYDVDYDDAGNCYVYGGIAPYQVLKFNSAGTLLWSYTETFTSGYIYYGGFAVDRVSQSVYLVDGYNNNTGSQIIKLNSSGVQLIVFPGTPHFTEMWRIAFSRCANEPVITGGGITTPSYEASYLDTNLTTLSPVNVLGTTMPHHDIWGLTFDDFGNCYMASMETEPGIIDTTFNNVLLKLPLPALAPTTWAVYDGYKFREISSTKYTSYVANGFNGMTASNTHLYTYDSYVIKKWNTANGALMSTLNVNGASKSTMDWAGITSDNCDNIFVGSKENILQYNSALALVGTVAMPDTVHDVILSKKKVLYACGKGFVYAVQETLPNCFTATNAITNPTCGTTTGSVIVTPQGGNAPYTITWNTTPQQNGTTANNLLPGTYIATISDNSCPHDTIYDTVTVAPASSNLNIVVNSPSICQGGTVVLTATGGATGYTWSPATGLSATTGSTVTANPATTTTYTIIGVASAGCTDTVQSIVTVNPVPVITIATPAPICSGGSESLAVSGATTYTWTPSTGLSATIGSSVTANPTTTTTYTITGTNGGGCSATTTVTVNVSSNPTITVATPASICSGDSATLTANGATTYTWSPSVGLSATTGSSVTADPTTTITYMVTGTNAGGCSATASVIVTVNPNPTITVNTPAPICSGGNVILTASGGTTYAWTPSTGLSATTGSSVTANPTATTTYTITGTNGSGCSATTTATVIVNPNPVITIAAPAPFCTGGSATLTVNGAATYTWAPSTGLSATTGSSVTSNPTTTTTYTITGINGNGCSATTTVTVTVYHDPVITVAAPAVICFGSSAVLTANGAATYTWTPSTGLSATTGSSVTANPTATTTYTITGTNGNGCSATTTVTVTVAPDLIITASTPAPICAGNNAIITASGAVNYTWTPSTGLNATTGSSVTANPTITTTYTITGTNGVGCTGTTTVIVTVNSNPIITVNAPAPICIGSSVTLTANGAVTYSWIPSTGLNSTTGSSVIANPTITTTYTVAGINFSGCLDTASVIVTVNPNPSIIVNTPAPICIGSSAILTANGAATYTWRPSAGLNATTGSSVTANPSATTTYTISGVNVNGCSDTTTVIVTVNSNPTITINTPAPICSGSSAILTANGAITYTWSPSTGLNATTGSSVTANPATTTIYIITGTNGSGCSATTTVTVTVNPNPTITVAVPAPICIGGSATLTANGATTYTWTPSTGLSATTGSTVTATPTATTTYTIAGTNGNGCTDTTTVTVIINTGPVMTVNTPSPICMGSSAMLSVSGATNYNWSPVIGLSPTAGSSVLANPLTTTTYTIIGTDSSGCTGIITVVVKVNPNPVITITTPAPICTGTSTTLTANGGTTYTWSPSTGLSVTTGSIVTANPTTNITYTVTVIDTNGCTGIDSVVVTVNPNPLIAVATPSPICNGSNTTLIATGGATYTWSPVTGLSTTTGSSITANPTTTTTYTITGTDINGCTGTSAVIVTVNPNPVITATTPAPICNGSNAILTASGAASYSWSPVSGLNTTTGSSVIATPVTTTTYIITGTDSNGCTGTSAVVIAVNQNPLITIATPAPICSGGSTILTVNGATSYTWSPAIGLSGTTGPSVMANPATSTTYTINGVNGNGCNAITTVAVTVNPNPAITVAAPLPICNGNNTTLTANGAISYTWTPSLGLSATSGSSVVADPGISTTYTTTGVDGNGCFATTTVAVTVNPNPTITVPAPAPICNGSSTTLTAVGATSYAWSPAIGLSATSGSSVTANPTSTTIYTVNGTNNNGCSATTTVTVAVNQNPVISVPTPMPICYGSSTALNATGAVSYSWSPSTGLNATTGSSVIANPTASTTYVINGIDGNGCTASTTVEVTVNANPVITASTPLPMCNGSSTTLTADGGIAYTWSPATGLSATSGSSVIANPSVSTTYIVSGINGNECFSTITVAVIVNPNPTISVAAPAPVCSGNSVLVSATGATTYTWTPAIGLSSTTGSTVTANPSTSKTYTITGTNGNGCTATTTVQVAINPNPTITATSPSPICDGSSTTLTTSGAVSYVWSPATGLSSTTGSSVTANPSTTVTYTIVGTDGNGCTAKTTVDVITNPNPVIKTSTPSPMCNGNNATLTANGALTYAWAPATGLSATTGAAVIAAPTTTTTYIVTGTDKNGCKASAIINLPVNPNPTIEVPMPRPYCQGDSTMLFAAGAISYTWSPATALSATTGSSVLAKPQSTQQYVVTGTDTNGCVGKGTVLVIVNTNPIIFASRPPAVCLGSTEKLEAYGATYYSWSPATALSASTGSSVIVTPTNSTTYVVVGTNDNGCSGKAQVQVLIKPVPNMSVLGLNSLYCMNAPPVLLSATPQGGTFSGEGVDSNEFIPALSGEGTFIIKYKYTDTSGCNDSITTPVVVAPVPKVIVSPNSPTICSGNPINLSVTGASSYVWSPVIGLSDSTGSSVIVNATTTTTYVIEGINTYGCSDTTMETVYVDSMPVAAFNAQPANYCNPLMLQFNNTSKRGTNYSWDFGDGHTSTDFNPQHEYERPGTYRVSLIVTSQYGCSDVIFMNEVLKTNNDDAVMIGDAFTPGITGSGEGINNTIAPHVLCSNLSSYVFRVYNRWGQLLFQSYDPNQGWDGTFQGQMQLVGVYDYYIEFNCGDCKIFKKGNITLLK